MANFQLAVYFRQLTIKQAAVPSFSKHTLKERSAKSINPELGGRVTALLACVVVKV
jgi:hypothetical protein